MNLFNKWPAFIIISIFFAGCLQSPQSMLNTAASVQSTDLLPENPLLLIPLNSSIVLRDSTMTVLYGNDIAAAHARTVGNSSYPKGSVLYEVTWKQQPDSVWFGANVPKEISSVERIYFSSDDSVAYELYKGRPIQKVNFRKDNKRVKFIVSQRMAVSP